MKDRAKVTSLDVLERFKGHLKTFMEDGRRALMESDADAQRTIVWIETDRQGHWKRELRRRAEHVAFAKNELARAKLAASDGRPDAIDEKRALEKAQRRYREAEQKYEATRLWSRRLQKEMVLYKGQCQALSALLWSDLPAALERIGKMSRALDEYVSIAPPPSSAAAREVEAELAAREPRSPHAAWRDRAPDAEMRFHTPLPDHPADVAPRDDAPIADRRAFRELDLPAEAARPDDKVVLDRGALASRRIVLVRDEPAHEGDSGWYVGVRGDAPSSDLEAMTVRGLRLRRPDLHELLDLPAGWSVVLDGTRIEAVVDPEGNDLLASGEARR